MKEFLLSDETVNSYGFSVLTNGIDTSRFEKNPVMFYNHDRQSGVIGKWESLRKDGNKLFGLPVFDEKDSLGGKIAGKVKDGFIKAASIGIENVVWGGTKDAPVVMSCVLTEISVCDIPSNENALVLYIDDKPVKDKNEILKLCKLKSNDMNEELKQIIEALGLPENATVNDIIKAIGVLKSDSAKTPEDAVNEALSLKLISSEEVNNMISLANSNPYAFQQYLDNHKEKVIRERREKGSVILKAAIIDGRTNATEIAKNFWLSNFATDFETTEIVMNSLPKRIRLSSLIKNSNTSSGQDRSTWKLNDYRKFAPKELNDNPELYQRLLREETANK